MLKSGAPLDPFGQQLAPSVDTISALAQDVPLRPLLCVILLASADADDLTLRAMRRLQAADLVITEGDAAAHLSERSRRDARLICHDLLPSGWSQALDPAERLSILLLSAPMVITPPMGWDVEYLQCGKAGL
jgi:hypothetical protein